MKVFDECTLIELQRVLELYTFTHSEPSYESFYICPECEEVSNNSLDCPCDNYS